MAETIEYEQFEGSSPQGTAGDGDLSRLSDVPMELSVEIGRTHMTVGEALDLHPGSVVTLERFSGEPADLLVNGTPIARGEVVVVDEQFGLRVTEILDRGPAAEPAAADSEPEGTDEPPQAAGGAQEAAAEPQGERGVAVSEGSTRSEAPHGERVRAPRLLRADAVHGRDTPQDLRSRWRPSARRSPPGSRAS